jgi:hypothetical protein
MNVIDASTFACHYRRLHFGDRRSNSGAQSDSGETGTEDQNL